MSRSSNSSTSARKKKRKRNLTLHYILVIFLVLTVGTVLSMTVFFNITEIKVIGEAPYDPQMIVDCSNIRMGDNLLRAKSSKAEQKILQQLVYIDTVEIKKTLPSKVIITVTKSEPFANLECDGVYLLISKTGKVLENMRDPKPDLPMIKGYRPKETSVGVTICSDDIAKDKLLNIIYAELQDDKNKKSMEIDITDRFNIKLIYDNRINIELGNQSDIGYKIKYAKTIIETEISPKKEGTLFILGDNEISFIEKADLEKFYEDYENAKTSVAESESSDETEKNGGENE